MLLTKPFTRLYDPLVGAKLRLTRGEIKQVEGPVTHQRYVFYRSSGTEVNDQDLQSLLAYKDGCCGVMYHMLEPMPEGEPLPYGYTR